MARKLRVEFPGAIYHVMLRGNWRHNIFKSDEDRKRFLKRLKKSADTYNTRIYFFCLMKNHAHLVVETPESNISRFMQSFTTGYTVYYNIRHNQAGHLFQGRFKAKLVDGDSYLLALSRYVHLNPVFTDSAKQLTLKERVKILREYRWSSYRSYIGITKSLDFVDYSPTLGLTGNIKTKDTAKNYRRFVEAGIAENDDDFINIMTSSRHSIGSDEFTKTVDKLYQKLIEKKSILEDVSFRNVITPIPAKDIIDITCTAMGAKDGDVYRRQRDNMIRPVAAYMLCKFAGMTQREVATILNLNGGSAVSLQLKKLNEQLSRDKQLTKLTDEITSILISKRLMTGNEETHSH
jgi:REP element-mobilizing transposase RayT